jgi:hypothetical protein
MAGGGRRSGLAGGQEDGEESGGESVKRGVHEAERSQTTCHAACAGTHAWLQGPALALLLASFGCGGGTGAPGVHGDGVRAAPDDTTLVAAALPEYGEESGDPAVPRVFPGGDPGIGLVHFATEGATPPGVLRLDLREAPDERGALVGRFELDMADGSQWTYRVLTRETGLRANLLEFGYEEWGIPLDSLSGEWARLILARGSDGHYRRGWARLGSGAGLLLWREWLQERAQFFASRPELRDEPGGSDVAFPLTPTEDAWPSQWDHHLEPDSIRGEWVRVRVVTPSDACGIEPELPVRDTVGWIRTVDDRGRPLVWYYARGC